MCGFVIHCCDFEKMTAKQRKALQKSLENRKKDLEARVEELTRAIDALKKE